MIKLITGLLIIFLSSCMTTIIVEKPDGTKIYYSSPKEFKELDVKYKDATLHAVGVTNDLAPKIVGQIVEKAIQGFMATQGTKVISNIGKVLLKNKAVDKVE